MVLAKAQDLGASNGLLNETRQAEERKAVKGMKNHKCKCEVCGETIEKRRLIAWKTKKVLGEEDWEWRTSKLIYDIEGKLDIKKNPNV